MISASNFSITNKADSVSDYVESNYLRFDDYTYHNKIKSVQFFNTKNVMSYPIMSLDGGDKLKLMFDDLDIDLKYYHYTLIHCNANWQPSDLVQKQYLAGNFDDEIRNYKYSMNSGIQYINYSVEFPNEFITPLVSGNYILKVYNGYNSDEVVITRRFMVVNNK